ncbi:hypothetical protein Tco_0769949 [Tanacetum coccineum]|uniref:Zinc finger, CCHC-type n=1 Tax=Tanacetum coccineum TaxID=301880 RepID=A0ABQ4ZAT4_9ASTR
MTTGESVKEMTSKFDKLAKFEGRIFRRWQKKMHFLLTTLKVVYVLSTPSPEWSENETLETTRKRMKWENDDYICRGHILNGMSDSLFDIYQNAESAKTLWESLESNTWQRSFCNEGFFTYTQHNLMMDEAISVAVIIDKLPPSWKEFKHSLKHKKEELNLVQLGSHLRIEEGLRNQELDNNPKGKNQVGSSSVNMKGTMTCWNVNKPGHIRRVCRSPSKGKDGAIVQMALRMMEVAWFYVIEPNDYVSVNSIIESRDAIFDEERFTSIPRPRGMIQPSSSKIAEDEVEGTDDVPGPSVPRKSTRTRKAKSVLLGRKPKDLDEAMDSRNLLFGRSNLGEAGILGIKNQNEETSFELIHGHGLTKGAIIQIFYHGLDEPTQGILDETAGGIFLYKSPNQAFQFLDEKVIFKLDWSTKSKNEHHQKSVAFADGSNSNNDNSRLMKKLKAMDSQITSLKENLQDMRDKYYDLRDGHADV